MAMWNPWRGCKKCSDGCLHCYIHKGDFKRNVNTNEIVKTKDFEKPIEKLKNGNYKMKSGIVYTCFSTDFLIEEADAWRKECWNMIKERQDCTFLFLTKRIDRFMKCIPYDWKDGYDNVVVCCTIENQKNADYKLSIFNKLPIKHKCITAQPLLEEIVIEKYLDDIELVVVGGESDFNARTFNYDWALSTTLSKFKINIFSNTLFSDTQCPIIIKWSSVNVRLSTYYNKFYIIKIFFNINFF